MNCIAHRGFAGVAPENTLPAIRRAVGVTDGGRADAVEVDVRRCGSGELVVCHDERVDRVTGETGAVADFTAGELAALSVAGGDAGVPTLAEVVAALPPEVTLHAELKEPVGADLEAAVADAAPEVVVSSFDADALAGVAELPRAWLVTGADGAVERAVELGATALHPPVDVCDRSLVERAREAGLAVNVWTVTDPDETRRLDEWGVDGVITDYPSCCPGRR